VSARRAQLRQAKRHHRVFRRGLAAFKRMAARLEAKPMLTPLEIRGLARLRVVIPAQEAELAGQEAALADFKGGMDGKEALRRHGLDDKTEGIDHVEAAARHGLE